MARTRSRSGEETPQETPPQENPQEAPPQPDPGEGEKQKDQDDQEGQAKQPDTSGDTSPDDFREEQKLQAQQQNQLGENAVPERRPIATQETLPSQQSETYRKLREEDKAPDQQKPMDQSAYQQAESQAESGEEGVRTRLIEGTRVRVTQEGPYEGKFGHVQRVNHDAEGFLLAASGNPGVANYTEPESYSVKLRGGRPELIELKADEVVEVSEADYGRSAA